MQNGKDMMMCGDTLALLDPSSPWLTNRVRLTLLHHRSMARNKGYSLGGAWAWVVGSLVVAGAIQVSLSYKYHGGVLDLITSYLIVLATGIVYGPLGFCRGQSDTTPTVLELQSYLPVKTAGYHGAQEECLLHAPQCATQIGDEDPDADSGMQIEEVCLIGTSN